MDRIFAYVCEAAQPDYRSSIRQSACIVRSLTWSWLIFCVMVAPLSTLQVCQEPSLTASTLRTCAKVSDSSSCADQNLMA